jgi:hypothetical protein
MRVRFTALGFVTILVGLLVTAISFAGEGPNGPGCCICEGCSSGPATQCFVLSDDQCQLQCAQLNCAEFIDTSIGCPSQPPCEPFQPPAPAPALAPAALAVAALGLAGVARRGIRR